MGRWIWQQNFSSRKFVWWKLKGDLCKQIGLQIFGVNIWQNWTQQVPTPNFLQWYVLKFLQACRLLAGVTTIQPWEIDCYISSWYQARETTSSLPSGIHLDFTWYRSYCKVKCFNCQHSDANWLSLKWWQRSSNVMLAKPLRNCNISKLWIIHLFKGNFNFNNTWLGKMAIMKTELQQLLAHKQYGIWKSMALINQCLNNKQLWYDLCAIPLQTSGTLFQMMLEVATTTLYSWELCYTCDGGGVLHGSNQHGSHIASHDKPCASGILGLSTRASWRYGTIQL